MKAKLTVERWQSGDPTSGSLPEWQTYATLTFDLPFANTRHFNICFELMSICRTTMNQSGWLKGRYRIGGDDQAIVEWNGLDLQMTERPRTVIVDTIEKTIHEIEEEDEGEEEKRSRN